MEEKKIHYLPCIRMVSISLVLLLLTYTIGGWVNIVQSFEKQNQEKEKLTISADGKIDAVPDIAILNLGVTTEGKKPEDIKDENTKKINDIIAKIKEQGIEEKDIKTLQLDLQPRYDWTEGKSTLVGYTIRQQVEVKIRDIKKAGDVFAMATDLGANDVNNIRYDFSDIEELKQQARKLALENAKLKAEDLVKTADINLGKMINFTENSVYFPPMYNYYGGMGMAKEATMDAVAPSPSIQPGSQEITASISVTYEIK